MTIPPEQLATIREALEYGIFADKRLVEDSPFEYKTDKRLASAIAIIDSIASQPSKTEDIETVRKHVANAKKHLEGLHSEREEDCIACKVLNSLELSLAALDRLAGKLG